VVQTHTSAAILRESSTTSLSSGWRNVTFMKPDVVLMVYALVLRPKCRKVYFGYTKVYGGYGQWCGKQLADRQIKQCWWPGSDLNKCNIFNNILYVWEVISFTVAFSLSLNLKNGNLYGFLSLSVPALLMCV
jgi:hypothetical protein